MANAEHGDTVQVHYTGKLRDGTVFDSSQQRRPLRFKIGAGNTLVSFEEAVIGMAPGETKTVIIPSAQAYGPHRKNMVRVMRRDLLPAGQTFEVGQRLRVTLEEGQTTVVTVTNVVGEDVMVDINHPLAGQDLVFDIALLAIE